VGTVSESNWQKYYSLLGSDWKDKVIRRLLEKFHLKFMMKGMDEYQEYVY